jgi:3-carboxy-cis,cis-muconate cycloisomerase
MTEQHPAGETMDSYFSTPAMSAVFSRQAHVRCLLEFEGALARAETRVGIIPEQAADAITEKCKAEFFDVAALYQEAVLAGTPAIPLVRMLTALVEGEAQKYVHWGATSQDAVDTALMLQMKEGIELLLTGLHKICISCANLAEHHRHTLMVSRTLLQQALPITFGLKAARWLALATRQLQALLAQRKLSLAVQLGGAAGTLASLGNNGLQVIEFLASELRLPAPDLPWHTERDRVAEIATTLGIIAGAMSKIAEDIVLLAQTEVGEVSEGTAPGKGGSSAMPQKRNPVDATMALASARLAIGAVPVMLSAMTQEHERAVGGWQAEWEAIPNLFCYTAAAVERVKSAIANLQVKPDRMKANLALTHGLIMSESLTMALARHMGRPEAYRLVQEACNRVIEGKEDLYQVVIKNEQIRAVLSPTEVEQALDPRNYLGSTNAFIDHAIATHRDMQP